MRAQLEAAEEEERRVAQAQIEEEEKRRAEAQLEETEKLLAKARLEEEEMRRSKAQLEEDELLAKALQESMNVGSPPRYDPGNILQPYPFLIPSSHR
jgi:phytoene dehydrogenase-like protein